MASYLHRQASGNIRVCRDVIRISVAAFVFFNQSRPIGLLIEFVEDE